MPTSLPYAPPPPRALLVLTSFLLLLNVLNHLLDKLINCGLITQVFLGVAFGTPGGNLLGGDVETAVVQLGYIGVVVLVFEGGLSTNIASLRANLALSLAVAATGIILPIGLSFVLLRLTNSTPLQAFAAGVALCSTSLGTTFTVLSACGLSQTRLGVVLATAAMLDDVVGLVGLGIISGLGGVGTAGGHRNGDGSGIGAATVLRPVGVSVGFVVAVCGVAWSVRKGLGWMNAWRERRFLRGVDIRTDTFETTVRSESFALTVHTLLLLGMVAAAGYAGTSDLFAAYLAGAVISWWDTEIPDVKERGGGSSLAIPTTQTASVAAPSQATSSSITEQVSNQCQSQNPDQTRDQDQRNMSTVADSTNSSLSAVQTSTTGPQTFNKYYRPALQRILKPFFFASIGFSVPVTRMLRGDIVWRGIVYSLLMFVGKLACGVWLVRVPGRIVVGEKREETFSRNDGGVLEHDIGERNQEKGDAMGGGDKRGAYNTSGGDGFEGVSTDYVVVNSDGSPIPCAEAHQTCDHTEDTEEGNDKGGTKPVHQSSSPPPLQKIHRKDIRPTLQNDSGVINQHIHRGNLLQDKPSTTPQTSDQMPDQTTITNPHSTPASPPISLYPSLILGAAMTARGEIGFLISSIAQSNGIFADDSTPSSSQMVEDDTSAIFLVVTWAIMLCTIVGPVWVGVLVRRVKRLERAVAGRGTERGALGVWGWE